MAVEAKYTIRAEDKSREGVASAERNLSGFRQSMDNAAKKIADAGVGMISAGKKMTMGITLPLVAIGVASVRAADSQKKAVAMLSQAVQNAGKQGEIAVANLEKHASEMQSITTFGDEVQLQAMAVIESMSGIGEEQLKQLNVVAMDMATQMDMDLQSVALQLGKYISGASNELRGIDIDGTIIGAANRASAVIKKLTSQFGGVAVEAAKVGLGPFEQFKNLVSDLSEKIGDILLPKINAVLEKSKGVIEWFSNLNPKVQEFLVIFAGIAAVAGPGLMFLGGIATAAPAIVAAVATLSGAFGSLATALGGLVGGGAGAATAGLIGGPFGLAIAGFAALSGKAADLAKDIAYWIMDDAVPKLKQFCTDVAEWFVNLATSIADSISKIARAVADWVGDKLASARDKVSEWVEGIKGKFEWLWDKLVGHSIIPDMVTEILDWMDVLVKGMDEKSGIAAEKTAGNLSGIGQWAQAVGLSRSGDAAGGRDLSGLTASLAGLVSAFGSMIAATETFTNFMAQVNLTLAPFIDQIAKPIVALLTPLVQILMRIVTALMPAFSAIFESLGRLLEATMPFWKTLGGLVVAIGTIFSWLAQKVIALGEVIYYAVTAQWGKIKTVDWGGNLFEMLKESTTNYQNAGGGLAALPASATGGSGSYGSGASYTTPRIINIAEGGSLITVNTEVITGDGGIDELVLMLRDRLRRVEALGY